MGAIDKDIFEVMDDPKRRQRLAMLLAWRTLRQSIARGRAMSLPNVLRLYLRIAHDINVPKHQVQRGFKVLGANYLAAQPFGGRALARPSLSRGDEQQSKRD